jgi:hypothetical protein
LISLIGLVLIGIGIVIAWFASRGHVSSYNRVVDHIEDV